jgi:uncharacterized protein YqgV (UPF0045/DUF77 family)
MTVQAEASLYPLRTERVGEAVEGFVRQLRRAGLTVRQGAMSTTVSADLDAVFGAMARAFATVADGAQVVLVLKVSNACPADAAQRGQTNA